MAKYTKIQLLDAFCKYHSYQDKVPDMFGEDVQNLIDNPETKKQFLDRVERERSLKDAVRQLQIEEVEKANEEVRVNVKGISLE